MNTLVNDVKDLMSDEPGAGNRMRAWVTAQLNHCIRSFTKYDNTIQKSAELLQGLYDKDVVIELLIAPTQFGKTSTVFWTAYDLMTHENPHHFVPYPFVFMMTGLNSNAWKEQTR